MGKQQEGLNIGFDLSIQIIKNLLANGQKVKLAFSGSSMLPEIKPGNYVIVEDFHAYEIGQIYVYIDYFSPTKRMVCHRLQFVIDDKYIFKGDNRNENDKPIIREQIIGKCVKIISQP